MFDLLFIVLPLLIVSLVIILSKTSLDMKKAEAKKRLIPTGGSSLDDSELVGELLDELLEKLDEEADAASDRQSELEDEYRLVEAEMEKAEAAGAGKEELDAYNLRLDAIDEEWRRASEKESHASQEYIRLSEIWQARHGVSGS